MSLYETQVNRPLGSAPNHIDSSELLDYFLYAYEFIWLSEPYQPMQGKIKAHFEELEVKASCSNEKKWWGWVLYALKDFSDYHHFSFASFTIASLLNRLEEIPADDLSEYANMIAFSYMPEMPESMSLRPLVIKELSSDAYDKDSALAYFLDRKDEFLSLFKKHLSERDIKTAYIEMFATNPATISKKYTNKWNVFFEIFVGYALSMLEMAQSTNQQESNIEGFVREVAMVYLVSAIKNPSKIESLHDDVANLVLPLYVTELH